jgi:hypothetical protein
VTGDSCPYLRPPPLRVASCGGGESRRADARYGQRLERLERGSVHTLEANYQEVKAPRQWFALVYAALNDEANTINWLERSADAHEWQVLNLAMLPFYQKMQNYPGF